MPRFAAVSRSLRKLYIELVFTAPVEALISMAFAEKHISRT
jgi:hypothetical protein